MCQCSSTIFPKGSFFSTTGIHLAKVLDYNMVYSQGLPNDKKVG